MLDRLPTSVLLLVVSLSGTAGEASPIEEALERRDFVLALSLTSRWVRHAVAPFQHDSIVVEDPMDALRLAHQLRVSHRAHSVFRVTVLNDSCCNEDAPEILSLLSVCTQLRELVLSSSRIFSSWFLRDVARYLAPTCRQITVCDSDIAWPLSLHAYFLPTVSVVSLEPGSKVMVDRATSQIDVTLTLDHCQRDIEARACISVFSSMKAHSALVRFDVPGCIDAKLDEDDTGVVGLLAASIPATLRRLALVPVRGCGRSIRLDAQYDIERLESLKLAISTLSSELPLMRSMAAGLNSVELDLSDHSGCTSLIEDLDGLKSVCSRFGIQLELCVLVQ